MAVDVAVAVLGNHLLLCSEYIIIRRELFKSISTNLFSSSNFLLFIEFNFSAKAQ